VYNHTCNHNESLINKIKSNQDVTEGGGVKKIVKSADVVYGRPFITFLRVFQELLRLDGHQADVLAERPHLSGPRRRPHPLRHA